MSSPYLVYIADVYCPWCYGFGPIFKKIANEHPELPVKVFGGNLMSNPTDLQKYGMSDPELLSFWEETQKTVGRSFAGAINALKAGKPVRMYSPGADLIFTTLKRLAPGHELDQLLMLEDMFYEKGEDIFTSQSLAELATAWKVDPAALINSTSSPKNEEATENNLETANELMNGIVSYPTVLLVKDNKVDAVSRGYVHYETVESRLQDAMRDLGIDASGDLWCSWTGNCALGKKREGN